MNISAPKKSNDMYISSSQKLLWIYLPVTYTSSKDFNTPPIPLHINHSGQMETNVTNLQGGPLLVINEVITPISGLING